MYVNKHTMGHLNIIKCTPTLADINSGLISHRDLQSSECVGIEYRLYGGFFYLRRLQAKTKTSSAMTSALQYADDAAFFSLTADGHQRNLDVISETYLRAGLIINTTKT